MLIAIIFAAIMLFIVYRQAKKAGVFFLWPLLIALAAYIFLLTLPSMAHVRPVAGVWEGLAISLAYMFGCGVMGYCFAQIYLRVKAGRPEKASN